MTQELKKISNVLSPERINGFIDSSTKSLTNAKTALSKYIDTPIKTEEEDLKYKAFIKKLKITITKTVTERKEITSKTDLLKKGLMIGENGLEELRVKLTKRRDERLNNIEAAKAAKAEQAAKELAIKNDIDTYKSDIIHSVKTRISEFTNATNKALSIQFESLTLDNSEALIKKLNIKPKLKDDVYNKMFDLGYSPTTLTAEQLEEIEKGVKTEYSHTIVNAQFVESTKEILKDWAVKFKDKEKILTGLKKKSKEEAELDRQELKRIEEEEKNNAIEAAKEEQKTIDEARILEAQNAKLQNEIESQAIAQQTETTASNRKVWTAEVIKITAYPNIIAAYIAQGGDVTKLQFLADFLAKNGQPEIKGVKYKSELKSIAR